MTKTWSECSTMRSHAGAEGLNEIGQEVSFVLSASLYYNLPIPRPRNSHSWPTFVIFQFHPLQRLTFYYFLSSASLRETLLSDLAVVMTPTDGPEPGPKTEETKQNAADNLDVSEQTLVNINAYKVDLSDAHIYKYVIKFSPVDYFSDKEKKKLAECFLGSLLLDLNPVDTVIGDDFEFFLPHPHAQLMQKYLQVPFARSDSRKEPYLEVKSFAPGGNQPVYSTFSPLTELCDKGPCGDVAISVPRVFEGLNICEVSAHRPQFILKNLLASKDSGSKSPVLAAVTKIFQRNATPTVSWHNEGKVAAVKGLREMGSKVFDFLELSNEEPVHIGSGFVVRRGINASTQIIAGSIFRVVSPTHGMFFEAGINLAELVVRFVGTAKLDEAKRGLLKKLLKGMTIIKAYGGKGMRHIVDLGDLPGEVKFVWG
jgi:hypothetical protein